MRKIFLILCLIAIPKPLFTSLPSVIIEDCYDGDTCTTKNGETIRLACIDTPEIKGERADPIPAIAAKEFLNNLLANEEVYIRRITLDKYGRTVAELYLNDLNVQEQIVNEGFGKIYKKYAHQCDWSRDKI